MDFVHLQVRSAYSLLDSTISIEALVSHAVKMGYKQIALTDKNNLYGAISFYQECCKQNIKPIIGITADILNDEETAAYPLILLAMNLEGYQNLIKISSVLQTKSEKGLPFRWLQAYAKGLIALTPGFDGIIETFLQAKDREKAKLAVEKFKAIFQGRFYLSLHMNAISQSYEQILRELARSTETLLVASQRVHYLAQEDRMGYLAMTCLSEQLKMADQQFDEDMIDYHLANPEEIKQIFKQDAKAVHCAYQIAEQCQLQLKFHQTLLPKYPFEQPMSTQQYLREICRKGLFYRYKQPTQNHLDRLEYELLTIFKMHYEDYFLIVWDFMRYARKQGILTGPGRGSAAGSIVAYALGITQVDPLAYGLLFERFLNPERISMPDIDIDFPDNRREEVIQYVAKKYGQNHVAQIITFGTFGAKSSVRDAGRVFGLEPKELDRLSRLIPSRFLTLQEAFAHSKELQELRDRSPLYQQIFQTAIQWEGLPRHTSVHAAGIVMSERPLTDIIPIQAGHHDVYQTQFPMEQIELIGLLKMDFLALRNLTLLDQIVKSVKRENNQFNLEDISFDDEKTYELISSGNTMGVFQLESDGMRNVIRKLKPNCFEDIIAVNALFRPGPMDNIQSFINRKHGIEAIEYPHPDLADILRNTYGIIVYQEQIMQIASKMAGFTLGEADLLRKAVSKKQRDILDQERKHFISGTLGKGYSQEVADKVYDLIVKFANYGFNRSHSVAYSIIAYQLSYLKANYPVHFMAEMMTSIVGYTEKIALFIQELKVKQIEMKAPSINKSDYGFRIEQQAIRFGLASIKGINSMIVREIINERKNGLFVDFFDFCIRVSLKVVDRKAVEALIYAGCFDEFGLDRAVYLASIDIAFTHADLINPDGKGIGLFGRELFIDPKYPEVAPLSQDEKLAMEKQFLGMYLSAHPATTYQALFRSIGISPFASCKKNDFVICGGYIHQVKIIRTKTGEQMAFLKISDPSAELEAVVFPKVYKQVADQLQKGTVHIFEGKVEEKNSQLQLIIHQFYDMNKDIQQLQKSVYIKISTKFHSSENLKKLRKILHQYRGNTKVYLLYEFSGETRLLDRKDWVTASETFIQEVKTLVGHCILVNDSS